MRILLVDDDIDLKDVVEAALPSQDVTHLTSLKLAHDFLLSSTPDLILLDVNLPDGNGFEFYQKIKTASERLMNVPVIFLTGRRGDDDLARGLQMGALDYIVKPFTPKALGARVQARIKSFSESILEIQTKNLKLDLMKMCAFIKSVVGNWTPVKLTKIEFQILLMLLKNKNDLVSRDTLISHLWEQAGVNVNEQVLSTHISHLRTKLAKYGDRITTIYGEGYKLKA